MEFAVFLALVAFEETSRQQDSSAVTSVKAGLPQASEEMSVEILQIEPPRLPGKVCSRQKFENKFTPVDGRPDFPDFLKKKLPLPRIRKLG
ncbi:MAG: hypothetical protein R3F19_20200 [Verrucomicrobiales bacterium]